MYYLENQSSKTVRLLIALVVISASLLLGGSRTEAASTNWTVQTENMTSVGASWVENDSGVTQYPGGVIDGGREYYCSSGDAPYGMNNGFYTEWYCFVSLGTYTTQATFDASSNKDQYDPGETVSVTISGASGEQSYSPNTRGLNAIKCFFFGCSGSTVHEVGVNASRNGSQFAQCSQGGGCTTSGSFTAPTTPGTYTVNVSGCWYSSSYCNGSSFNITVASPPPTATLTQSKSTTAPGEQYSISWGSTNATSCTVSYTGPDDGGTISSGPTSGGPLNLSTTIAGTYVATNSCTGPGGTDSKSVTHTVSAPTPPPPTSSSTNGACSSPPSHYACSAGTSSNNQSNTSTWTWNCTGSGGGTTASCSESKYPDLTAGATTATPSSGTVGQQESFSAQATNIGSGVAASFPNIFQIADSSQTTTIARVNAGTVARLSARGSAALSGSYTFASPGTYSVRACANMNTSGNTSITESNTNNNCGAWQTLSISAPAAVPSPGSCTLPWGGTINDGSSVTAYQSSSVTSPASCVSQTRTCNNGNLSGSYQYQSCSVNNNSPAPTASLTASPNPVAYNGRSTLTWSSSNATSCTAGGPWSNQGTLSGSGLTNPLTSDTLFTFQCTGPGGTSPLQSVTVTVTAASCTLPWGGTLASGSSVTAYQFPSVTSPTTCASVSQTRTCTNGTLSGSYTNQSCSVTGSAPTALLSANPTTIDSGESSTLTWSSTNATSCTSAGGFSTGGATSGNASTGALTATQNYQISCSGPGGSALSNIATVTVTQPQATITASPGRVRSGTTSTISWSGSNVTSCEVTDPSGTKLASGNADNSNNFSRNSPYTATITSQSTFTIVCKTSGGGPDATDSVTVNLIPSFLEF